MPSYVSQLVMSGGSFPNQTCTKMSTVLVTLLWSAMGKSFFKFTFLAYLFKLHLISLFMLFIARSMYVFGGFSGMLLNDVLVYRPPSCQAFVAEESCVQAGPGVRCIWSRGRCFPWEPSMTNESLTLESFCPTKPGKKHRQTSAYFFLWSTMISVFAKVLFFLHAYVF